MCSESQARRINSRPGCGYSQNAEVEDESYGQYIGHEEGEGCACPQLRPESAL